VESLEWDYLLNKLSPLNFPKNNSYSLVFFKINTSTYMWFFQRGAFKKNPLPKY